MSKIALNWTIAPTLTPKWALLQAAEIGIVQRSVEVPVRDICAQTSVRNKPLNGAEMTSATTDPAITELTRRRA